jgi:hypothetical protein
MTDHIVDAADQATIDAFDEPDGACVKYGEWCQNIAPHNSQMCADCLDKVRERDSNT